MDLHKFSSNILILKDGIVMPINKKTQNFLDNWAPAQTITGEYDVIAHRKLCQSLNELSGEPLSIDQVQDLIVDGPHGEIPVRYFGFDDESERPALIYFPTGGFVGGDCISNSTMCQNLAHRTGYRVFLVDFHKAPEFPCPAAVDDAYHVTRWVSERHDIDPDCIVVEGDSAGGNLALQTVLLARDKKEFKIRAQVLMMPWVDLSCSLESVIKNDGKGVSSAPYLKWAASLYLPKGYTGKEPEVSPLFRNDLQDLPETIIIAAEYDAQANESRLLAEHLQQAGNSVTYSEFSTQVHIFMHMEEILIESRATNIWLAEMLKSCAQTPIDLPS